MTTERLRKGLTKKFSQNVMLWQVDVKLAGLRQEKLEIYIANSAILISCEGWTKSHLPSRSNCTAGSGVDYSLFMAELLDQSR